MFGSQIRDKDGVAATVSFSYCHSWHELTHLKLFLAHIHGNSYFTATIRADGARVFR